MLYDISESALYADDTKIWRKIVDWSDNDHEILPAEVDVLQGCVVRNKMKFHLNKWKVLSFSSKMSENGI